MVKGKEILIPLSWADLILSVIILFRARCGLEEIPHQMMKQGCHYEFDWKICRFTMRNVFVHWRLRY